MADNCMQTRQVKVTKLIVTIDSSTKNGKNYREILCKKKKKQHLTAR